ncbi:MAG: glycosyltransferase family 2 protein [Alphaproteobacteria bacterium]
MIQDLDANRTSEATSELSGEKKLVKEQQAAQPRIICLSMVKNEQDIIEPFILHNAQFFDAMIIADNNSSDATRDIIRSCQAQIEGVFLCDTRKFGYNQAERMTSMLLHCQGSFFADYIFFLDADEFISAQSRQDLLPSLSVIPKRGVGLMPWRTHVLRKGHEKEDGADAPRSLEYCREYERPQFYKAVLSLAGEFDPFIRVVQGNHYVIDEKGRLPEVVLRDVPLLHFPIRSQAQLTAKIVVGWAAYLKKNPQAHKATEGFHWRGIFEKIAREGDSAVGGTLALLSQNYATTDPVSVMETPLIHCPGPFKYKRVVSKSEASDPIAVISSSWQQTLRAQDPLMALNRPKIMDNENRAAATSFNAVWHWDHLFVDIAPFRYLAEKFRPSSVLDIGCGIGQYLKVFKTFAGSSVLGVDGIPQVATESVLTPSEYIQADLGQPILLNQVFDLVLCTEVVEHLSKNQAIQLVDTIHRHAGRLIVFSAAGVNQPGYGHINCQPLSYWLEQWRQRGWAPLLIESMGIRALASLSWFRRNLIVLSKSDMDLDAEFATHQLERIAAKAYGWFNQGPGIREEPFGEPRFAPGEGYVAAIKGG